LWKQGQAGVSAFSTLVFRRNGKPDNHFFQGLDMGTVSFSEHWMARSAPQEISRQNFQGLEKPAGFFPGLGKTRHDCAADARKPSSAVVFVGFLFLFFS
jgi:hypothetical protein